MKENSKQMNENLWGMNENLLGMNEDLWQMNGAVSLPILPPPPPYSQGRRDAFLCPNLLGLPIYVCVE